MHKAYKAMLGLFIVLLFNQEIIAQAVEKLRETLESGSIAQQDVRAQSLPEHYITLGAFKLTLGLKQDDVFQEMAPFFWFRNMTPASDFPSWPAGYRLYFVYPKTEVPEKDLPSKSYAAGELGFQDGSLVLAMRMWLQQDPRENFVDMLSQAMRSVSEGSADCKMNPPIPPGAYPNVKIRVQCGIKSLHI